MPWRSMCFACAALGLESVLGQRQTHNWKLGARSSDGCGMGESCVWGTGMTLQYLNKSNAEVLDKNQHPRQVLARHTGSRQILEQVPPPAW